MPLILLAEDEAPTIDHVRSVLASQGWLVKTVDSSDQALRAASEFAPQLVLVNDQLAGVADLVRTFSRRSGGPGIVLLSSAPNGASKAEHDARDVDGVLKKPLETENLISTVRDRLAEGQQQKTISPLGKPKKIFTSQEIFGDLLDDILDPEDDLSRAKVAGAKETTAAEPPGGLESAAQESEAEVEAVEVEELAAEPAEQPATAAVGTESDDEMADLEDMVREEVGAWAEGVDPGDSDPAEVTVSDTGDEISVTVDAFEESEVEEEIRPEDLGLEPVADPFDSFDEPDSLETPASVSVETDLVENLTAAMAVEAESDRGVVLEPIEQEEDLDNRLDDTLAGVLADSLSAAGSEEADDDDGLSVDALLSSALGDLNLGSSQVKSKTKSQETEAEAAEEVSGDSFPLELDAAAIEPGLELGGEELDAAEAEPEPEEMVEPAAAVSVPAPASQEFGDYTLEKRIGLGGMAEVWKARRKGVEGFQKRVAIKKILPQAAENEAFVEMFIDEAKLAAQLNHNNIIHIYDLGRQGDDYYIAMEYVDGKNLRQILTAARKTDQPMPEGIALYVAARLADALDYAHRSKDFNDAELGLVHRDVSPQNVLISLDGDIKLCDFGIAKAVSKMSTTQMGALKGKLQYMSPEQAWGKSIDHRSDIFSLGTLLFEMLTGERLFTGESEMSVLETVRECDVASRIIQTTEIPAAVKGLLLRALAREPESRFDSASELQAGLEEILAGHSPAPSQKDLAAYVKAVGGEPAPHEGAAAEEILAGAEVPESSPSMDVSDAPWIADPGELDPSGLSEEELRKQAWLKKLLTRLLPVILLLAALGGILGYAWTRQEAASTEPHDSSARAPTTEVASAVDAANPSPNETTPISTSPIEAPQDEDGSVAPVPAPVAASADTQTTDTQSERVPTSTDIPATELPETETSATEIQTSAAVDPELEQRVEQDLQRVQALIDSPDFDASAPDAETESQQPSIDEAAQVDAADQQTVAGTVEDAEPRLISFSRPEPTVAAVDGPVEGTINLSVLVDESGRVVDTLLVEGLSQYPGLDDAVLEAARRATFEPGLRGGEPTPLWYELTIQYER